MVEPKVGFTFDDLINESNVDQFDQADAAKRQQSCYVKDLNKDDIPEFMKKS